MSTAIEGNLQRFSGFAELYDALRPSPPQILGSLICTYAGSFSPRVVDLGSGSGLSSRWAASWAASVTGIEPNDDMCSVAESLPTSGVEYRRGLSDHTGLVAGSADVVLAVQSMHWMEPDTTLAEVGRILRPGGVMAAVDADWPPVSGRSAAERAWVALDRRIGILEKRLTTGQDLRHPVGDPPAPMSTLDVVAPPGPQDRGGGVRSWGKNGHLARMASSGRFAFTREVVLHATEEGGADRFVGLMRTQGGYQQLRRHGLSDAEIGMDRFEEEVRAAYDHHGTRRGGGSDVRLPASGTAPEQLVFCWRVRIGVMPLETDNR